MNYGRRWNWRSPESLANVEFPGWEAQGVKDGHFFPTKVQGPHVHPIYFHVDDITFWATSQPHSRKIVTLSSTTSLDPDSLTVLWLLATWIFLISMLLVILNVPFSTFKITAVSATNSLGKPYRHTTFKNSLLRYFKSSSNLEQWCRRRENMSSETWGPWILVREKYPSLMEEFDRVAYVTRMSTFIQSSDAAKRKYVFHHK